MSLKEEITQLLDTAGLITTIAAITTNILKWAMNFPVNQALAITTGLLSITWLIIKIVHSIQEVKHKKLEVKLTQMKMDELSRGDSASNTKP